MKKEDVKSSSISSGVVTNYLCNILGGIALNNTMIDVTEVPDVQINDLVILLND